MLFWKLDQRCELPFLRQLNTLNLQMKEKRLLNS